MVMGGDWRSRLRQAITASRRSLRSIALEAGLSPGYLNHVLKDEKDPAFDKVVAICRALGISVADLIESGHQNADTAELLEFWASIPKDQRKALLQVFAGVAHPQHPRRRRR